MTTPRVSSDRYTTTAVRLPERELADVVLEIAQPVLEKLGPAPSLDHVRAAIELTVTFWNASVLASQQWARPSTKALNQLKRLMRARGDLATFDLLTERRRALWRDPRLVESWTCDRDDAGKLRLVCTMELPGGVRAEAPPPAEKRVTIGGAFLDEVLIRQGPSTSLSFPVDRHRAVIGEDGTATVHAMMPTALQLLADGRLPRIGGGAVEIAIGLRDLGPMLLAGVSCAGASNDVAILVFEPAKRRAAENGIP